MSPTPAGQRRLGQRDGEAAVGRRRARSAAAAVARALGQAASQSQRSAREVGLGDAARHLAEDERLVLGAVECGAAVPSAKSTTSPSAGSRRGTASSASSSTPTTADDGRRLDRLAAAARCRARRCPSTTGSAERLAGLGHALDRLGQLVADLGRSGLPKFRQLVIAAGSAPVQATLRAACATALCAAAAGIERHARAVAVERDRDGALARESAARRRRRPRAARRCPSRRAGRTAGRPSVLAQMFGAASSAAAATRDRRSRAPSAAADRVLGEPVAGRSACERVARRVGERLARACRRRPRRRRRQRSRPSSVTWPITVQRQLPACADGLGPRPSRDGLDDRRHALLRLRDHDLERLHALLAQRHAGRGRGRGRPRRSPPSRRSTRRARPRRDPGARRPGRAPSELERALDQLLAGERVADLHARALVLVALVEILRGEHAGAADAVAARSWRRTARPGCPGPRRSARTELVGAQHADAHRVDEAVAARRRLEDRPRRRRSATPTQLP